jgi:hypothetical protein
MRAQEPAGASREPQSSQPYRPLFLLFWCIGILIGLFARDFIETAGETVGPPRPVSAASTDSDSTEGAVPASTLVVNVHAVLDLPTATATGTATPRPTSTPEQDPQLDFCGALPAEEGTVCRMPMPTATATATLPACYSPQAEPGKLCQYRATATPAPHEQSQPQVADGGRN